MVKKFIDIYIQEFHPMEHFKQELIEYLDYYNNRRIKAKLKGLPPAIHRQQALSAAWTIFASKYCLTFRGHFKMHNLWSLIFTEKQQRLLKNGATTIFWTHDDVLYHLYGTVSTDGLSKVAENIE